MAALPPTEETIEGPFYRPDAPMLEAPYSLVRRPGERGAVLVFSGSVSSTAGAPLPGALVDIWHASAAGRYAPGAQTGGEFSSLFDARQPAYNLRGRLRAGEGGAFEFSSVVPGAYEEPPGSFALRPAHLHFRISHDGFRRLTTQIFFAEDPHLASDPVHVVRPGLIARLERRADPIDLTARGLLRPYFACRFAFVLQPGDAGLG
ncbi:MAG TPA: hypothetical protein VFW71_02920 [Actinomycetota bacterium]|nr:hypothetical protein [Actinomycetota bacterium]